MKNSNSKQLTIQQAITDAKKAIKRGNASVAVELYKAVLKQQPNHPVAKKKLKDLQKEFPTNQPSQVSPTKPSQDQIIYVVKNGIGVMQAWEGILTKEEIEAVAYFVFNSTNE